MDLYKSSNEYSRMQRALAKDPNRRKSSKHGQSMRPWLAPIRCILRRRRYSSMAASCTAARDCEEPHLYPDCLRSMRSIEDCRHGRGIRDTDINNIFNRSQRSRTGGSLPKRAIRYAFDPQVIDFQLSGYPSNWSQITGFLILVKLLIVDRFRKTIHNQPH